MEKGKTQQISRVLQILERQQNPIRGRCEDASGSGAVQLWPRPLDFPPNSEQERKFGIICVAHGDPAESEPRGRKN